MGSFLSKETELSGSSLEQKAYMDSIPDEIAFAISNAMDSWKEESEKRKQVSARSVLND